MKTTTTQARSWVPVDVTRRVRKLTKKPAQVTIHGKKHAVYWSNGQPQVVDDVCWHRGASLSAGGAVTGDGCVKCKYHGLVTSPGAKATALEQDGLIWLPVGEGALPSAEIAPPTSWEFHSPTTRTFDYVRRFEGCNAVLVTENTLDWSHLDTVHLFHLIDGVPEVEVVRSGYNGMARYRYTSKVLGDLVIENEYWGPWSSCLRFVINERHSFTIFFAVTPHSKNDSTLLVRVSRSELRWPLADMLYLAVNELPLWEDRYVVKHADAAAWKKNRLTPADAFLKEYRAYLTKHHPDIIQTYLN
jgi:phenylpropionate dioxygenase-like ring-hydroxylating dioxygenase large terminal subunit